MSYKPRIGSYEHTEQYRGKVIVFNENYEADGTLIPPEIRTKKPWLVIKAGGHKGKSFETFAEAIGVARVLARSHA